jgi:hypothetical protein
MLGERLRGRHAHRTRDRGRRGSAVADRPVDVRRVLACHCEAAEARKRQGLQTTGATRYI